MKHDEVLHQYSETPLNVVVPRNWAVPGFFRQSHGIERPALLGQPTSPSIESSYGIPAKERIIVSVPVPVEQASFILDLC